MPRGDSGWFCPVYDELLVRHWESEFFIFNPQTGHTHILNEFAWHILSACQSQRQGIRDLSEQFTIEDGEESGAALLSGLEGHLAQLEQLGLLVQGD